MDLPDPAAFAAAYAKLNVAQKKAVDTVEGPVLVIAGPGTGKTHVLTLRIANILRQTQANATNVLVLTFTESAARTVRARLAGMIGETSARDVFISTFHGFAEHLLSTFPDSFPRALGKRLAGDVESTLLWREVLEDAELVALRTTKSPFFYLNDLARLRDDLLRERISLDAYRQWAEEEAERIKADPENCYVRGEKRGELKAEGQKKLERLGKVFEAARLIEAYEALKEARGVYDFADVLDIAVEGLAADAELRAEVQEQWQYVLADEHQDANALQHRLLDLLAYDEHPNLFVVGDEKQAIYRFQGADSSNFRAFLELYPRTEVVYLTDSYRSLQGILDASHGLIQAVPASQGTHQALSAVRAGEARLELLAAADPLAETSAVAGLVEEAIAAGTPPHEIAVIASRNATADRFAEHLAARGVPTLRAGDVLLSARPLLRAVLALMRAVADPLDRSALRESLLAPWWPMPLPERAALLLKHRDHELAEALERAYPDVAARIAALQQAALDTAPLPLLSKLLADTGARSFFLSHPDHLEDVALLRKLLMHVEELVARDPNVSFAALVSALTKAHEHGLESVKTSVTLREGLVTVITAHKAKGMEFEKVFLVGCTAREWEKHSRGAVIPSPVAQARTVEDATKLFYVALTRAKDCIVFSYAQESAEGRDQAPSALIPAGLPVIAPEADPLPLLHAQADGKRAVHALVARFLAEEGLSPSALNEYLESPPTFFARRVLRLHEPEAPATAIGTSVHAGIAAYLNTKDEEQAYAALERALSRSLLPRTRKFDELAQHARQSLGAYIAQAPAGAAAEPVAVEKKQALRRTVAGTEILLQGQVDAVFPDGGGECIVDFKTSSDVHIQDEKHARQLAFYDLLLRADGHATTSAKIVQVKPDGVTEYPVPLSDETRAALLETLEEAVAELLAGKWRAGEPSEYDDLLALFG